MCLVINTSGGSLNAWTPHRTDTRQHDSVETDTLLSDSEGLATILWYASVRLISIGSSVQLAIGSARPNTNDHARALGCQTSVERQRSSWRIGVGRKSNSLIHAKSQSCFVISRLRNCTRTPEPQRWRPNARANRVASVNIIHSSLTIKTPLAF